MKQFDLEEYKKNPNRKVVTREGKPVKILCTDARRKFSIVALVETDGRDDVLNFLPDGRWCGLLKSSENDLLFAPEKKERWVSVYRNVRGATVFGLPYLTKEEALYELYDDEDTRIDTIKVEWEE